VRFERISGTELRLSLEQGHVDVDFHPEQLARQSLTVESRFARVRVIGTRFSVDVDVRGNTEVRVVEGTVEVVPRFGGEARQLRAGEQTEVLADEGDAYERAVRSALEENLSAGSVAAEGSDASLEDGAAIVPEGVGQVVLVDKSRSVLGPVAIARRLEQARMQLRQGRHVAARARLQEIADTTVATQYRAEALTLVAESYAAQGQIPRAAAAYRRVVSLAAGHPAAHNAQFALARLLERYTGNRQVAAQAYRHYLDLAPAGALAAQAREALCRLGCCK
jgi:tetratricopeptide (TPR) repeat protein